MLVARGLHLGNRTRRRYFANGLDRNLTMPDEGEQKNPHDCKKNREHDHRGEIIVSSSVKFRAFKDFRIHVHLLAFLWSINHESVNE